MRIRVLGGGWYGSHLSLALLTAGHDVELHETAHQLFAGASGNNPARLHLGFHYPRSRLTRAACQENHKEFVERYGALTEGIAENIYAVAAVDSVVDFGTYCQVLRGEVEFVTVDPRTYGLVNVEGAMLTGERHIVPDRARAYFTKALAGHVEFHRPIGKVDDLRWDWTIDATFCANDAGAIDRYEPCVMVVLEGPTHKAVTIMDGPFGSVYPLDEEKGFCSLTNAKLTPVSKVIRTYDEAQKCLNAQTSEDLKRRGEAMVGEMQTFYPAVRDEFRVAEYRLSIRAMPKSAADARLVDVVRVGERALRVRAGKIDAIMHAERIVREAIEPKGRLAA